MFAEDLSIIVRYCKQPKCPSVGGQLNHGISTPGNTNQQFKKRKTKT